jgi:hypothetical protein
MRNDTLSQSKQDRRIRFGERHLEDELGCTSAQNSLEVQRLQSGSSIAWMRTIRRDEVVWANEGIFARRGRMKQGIRELSVGVKEGWQKQLDEHHGSLESVTSRC